MNDGLAFYYKLSRVNFPCSYIGKLTLIAFLGIHVPLLTVSLYIALGATTWSAVGLILLVGVVTTLVGLLVTLVIQRKLLAPVLAVSGALSDYLESGTLPNLPTHYPDDIGQLMANAQHCILHCDRLLQMKNNILSTLSHDLRNPINTVVLGTEIVQRELTRNQIAKERAQKHLVAIRSAAQNQIDLLSNTMALVQSESGQLTITVEPTSPQALLQQLLPDTLVQAESKGVLYHVDWENASTAAIDIDVKKTVQVLTNLVNQSIRLTPAGGKIEVTTSMANDEVHFSVKDNGLCVDDATGRHPLTPLSHGEESSRMAGTGADLGMWICKAFIEAQGGRVVVDRRPGVGSCYTVILHRQGATSVTRPDATPRHALPRIGHHMREPIYI